MYDDCYKWKNISFLNFIAQWMFARILFEITNTYVDNTIMGAICQKFNKQYQWGESYKDKNIKVSSHNIGSYNNLNNFSYYYCLKFKTQFNERYSFTKIATKLE